jgi:hypothetical protein
MRFLCIYKPGQPERDTPPTQDEMATMGRLIDDMSKAGVLLATEGCQPSKRGARVRVDGRAFNVTDGPFPETKELIAGFCMMQVKSKAEAVEWAKRFLSVAGVGQTEIYQLHDLAAWPPA